MPKYSWGTGPDLAQGSKAFGGVSGAEADPRSEGPDEAAEAAGALDEGVEEARGAVEELAGVPEPHPPAAASAKRRSARPKEK